MWIKLKISAGEFVIIFKINLWRHNNENAENERN
jgi:hypothetical protein